MVTTIYVVTYSYYDDANGRNNRSCEMVFFDNEEVAKDYIDKYIENHKDRLNRMYKNKKVENEVLYGVCFTNGNITERYDIIRRSCFSSLEELRYV